MRIIVGVTGATGAPLAVALLKKLSAIPDVETHLIISRWGKTTLEHETGLHLNEIKAMADVYHNAGDQAATLSSGSFITDGMIIIPCSMKTLAGIRSGYAEGLIGRAADVILKEQRKLVLVPRETPLNTLHLENMLALSRMGVSIIPPVPAWYNHPSTLADVEQHIAGRVLDQFGINMPDATRWQGLSR
ncbi:UbiX family flavin prenyltransferase [Pantoea sp. GL120224-02]|jgi:flavin prenyltransferase|uniref:UbiX family flavin prenyltransferase n=1 Tax=Pantoea sp. GL120224-02 TaxID=1378084 RepID=UPI000BC8D35D|nr:UbiX family flavin prenyltransferase [Pantoea sp. GL120224-02]MDF7630491.1 UbiX family flavin prenyltransferase [Erwiniaceae bacterium L1_55_4]SNY70932.1 4-hydroxy-3-polyprenylbenzoate decarboxylase [Pantoea sp. GL120224-02]